MNTSLSPSLQLADVKELRELLCGTVPGDQSFASEAPGYFMSTACLIIFSAAGVLYIEALRVRLQAVRDARLALHADKRFSAYVYALPVLAYMVVTSAALFRGMSHEKCELCMFGLISSLLLALYRTPTSRAAKLIVWENATERCCVWLPSASCTLSTAQQRIADAMDVKPASRIRFCWGDAAEGEDLAADLDLSQSVMPLFISQVGQSPLTDFFGFPVTVCQISVAEGTEMATSAPAAVAGGGALAAGDGSPGRGGRSTPRKSVYKQPQVPSTPTEPEIKPSMLSKLFPSSRKKTREARVAVARGAVESSGHSVDKDTPRDSESSSLDTSTPAKATRKWPFLLKSRSTPSKTGEITAADSSSKDAIQGLSPPPSPTPSSSRKLSLRRSSSTPSLSSKCASISPSHATNSNITSLGVSASGGSAIDTETRTLLHTAPKPRKEQIEAYVDAILRDPTMNLAGIPDNIEKKIYTIGISLALTACLKVIFAANGKTILGHHVELEVRPQPKFPVPPTRATGSELRKIEKLVDELLKEEMINLKWLPDRYEKPLYVNVISAVITVMQSVFAAAKVDFLGQVMAVKIGPSEEDEDEDGERGDGGDEIMTTARRFTQRMVSMRRVSEEVLDEQLDIHFATSGHVHWLLSDRRERAMLKTVYALVLCSIDEIFKELKINFIGDEVRFHLIAGPMPDPPPDEAAAAAQQSKKSSGDKTSSAAAADAAGGGAGGGGAAGRGGAGKVYGQHELILAALSGALLGSFLFR